MRKLTAKNLIAFRNKNERSKRKFVDDLKVDIEKESSDGGGDYWVSCVSALCNAFRRTDPRIIKNKMEELEEKLEKTNTKTTKNMYKRNIEVLYNYEGFDFRTLQPKRKMVFQRKPKTFSLLTLKGLQVQSNPSHVFTFERNGVTEIGAVWFIAKLGGYKKDELGIFADILFRYLKTNYSDKYVLNSKYCVAVDVVNANEVNYAQIQKLEVPDLLNATLSEIKKFIN